MDSELGDPQPKLRAVQSAKEALLRAMQEAVDDSSTGLSTAAHILTQPPAYRQAALTAAPLMHGSIEEINDVLDGVISEPADIKRRTLAPWRARVQMPISPIGSLPPEILRDIFTYAVGGPHDIPKILYLSHVNQSWRGIVHEIGGFFTKANYDEWPTWMLKDWCARARAGRHLLTVQIGGSALHRLWPAASDDTEFRDFIMSTKSEWEYLNLDGDWDFPTSNYKYLLDSLLPNMKALRLVGKEGTIDVESRHVPVLEDLELSRVSIQFSQPSESLRSASIMPYEFDRWPIWSFSLEQSPFLTSLTLNAVKTDNLLQKVSPLTLPALAYLQLDHMDAFVAIALLEALEMPKLTTLSISFIGGGDDWLDIGTVHMSSLLFLHIKQVHDVAFTFLVTRLRMLSLRSLSLTLSDVTTRGSPECWTLLNTSAPRLKSITVRDYPTGRVVVDLLHAFNDRSVIGFFPDLDTIDFARDAWIARGVSREVEGYWGPFDGPLRTLFDHRQIPNVSVEGVSQSDIAFLRGGVKAFDNQAESLELTQGTESGSSE